MRQNQRELFPSLFPCVFVHPRVVCVRVCVVEAKLELAAESPGGLVKAQISGFTLRVSDSVGLR